MRTDLIRYVMGNSFSGKADSAGRGLWKRRDVLPSLLRSDVTPLHTRITSHTRTKIHRIRYRFNGEEVRGLTWNEAMQERRFPYNIQRTFNVSLNCNIRAPKYIYFVLARSCEDSDRKN